MKRISTFMLVALITTAAIANTTVFLTEYNILQEQPKETKEEVNVKKLPKEVTFDITKNFNGAEIKKAYKTFINGEFTGYLVEAEKGKEKWSITYDKKGKPINKVKPNL